MPTNLTPENWFTAARKTWGLLIQFAVFILSVASSFLLPPPGWASTDDTTLVRLGQFIVAVLAGLVFLLILKWSKKKHVLRWAITALIFLVLTVVAFFVYQRLLDTRICEYDGGPVVIGTQYTDRARTYLSENPDSTCTSLLDDVAGEVEAIWLPDSINRSRHILAAVYILTLPLLTICIIAVVQALYCSQTRTRRK